MNLEDATWKANALMTELPLLNGLDVGLITKPSRHETFGLLDFLILGVRLSDS